MSDYISREDIRDVLLEYCRTHATDFAKLTCKIDRITSADVISVEAAERREIEAYFAGEAYGWEQGRKALIDDVKAEFIKSYPTNYMGEPELNGASCHFSLNNVLQILDNIGKAESEEVYAESNN